MATAAELAILLKLHDEMSAGLKKAQTNVDGFGKSLSKVGTIATGFLAAAGIGIGIQQVTSLFKSATAAAEEHARVEAQVQAVIKSTGGAAGVSSDEVFKLADAYQNVTRFSDEQVASAEALLLTFTRIGKDIFPQATETVLNMATALGEDTSSAAIQLGKALQDPILGVTALRRVGVAFTTDQQAQIKALVESGHGMAAQKIILAELTKEFGGSATALTDWEKKWRRVTVAVDEGKESFGRMIQGGLILFSNWLDEHGDDIENFVGKFQPAFDAVQTQVETSVGAIIGTVQTLIDTINSISDLVSDLAHGRWQSAWEDMLDVVGNFGKSLLNNLVAIFGALPNLVIDAVNKAIDAINGIQLPKEINTGIIGSVPIPGGGGGLNIPNIPNIPTKPFNITGAIEQMQKLGEEANKASPPVRTVVDDFKDGADQAGKYADALKKFQDEMGAAVQSFLGLSAIKNAVSALFGQPTREQADLTLKKITEEERRARQGERSVHFGPGEGPGVNDPAKIQKQLDLIKSRQDLEQAQITAANALLLTNQQQATEAEKLRDLTEQQSNLIRDQLNPAVTDLIPELNTARTTFQTFNSLLASGGDALLTFSRKLSDFKLPELKDPNASQTAALNSAFQGP